MARITIEDCLKRVPNRFVIVQMAAKRVRQIREGSEYLVSSPKNEDIVVALREIAAGKVVIKADTGKKIAKASEQITEQVAEQAEEHDVKQPADQGADQTTEPTE